MCLWYAPQWGDTLPSPGDGLDEGSDEALDSGFDYKYGRTWNLSLPSAASAPSAPSPLPAAAARLVVLIDATSTAAVQSARPAGDNFLAAMAPCDPNIRPDAAAAVNKPYLLRKIGIQLLRSAMVDLTMRKSSRSRILMSPGA